MAFLVLIALILLLVLFLHYYIQESRVGKIVNRLPGPPVLPVIGNALQLNVTSYECFKLLRSYRDKYYPVYRIWLLNQPVISICHPDDFEILLSNRKFITKDFGYVHLRKWLKKGLLTSGGDHWFQRRKILTPAFHVNVLKELVKTVIKNVDSQVDEIKKQGSELTVDLVPFIMKITLLVICESSMGVALDGEDYEESAIKYKKSLNEMVDLIVYRNFRPYLKDWALPFLPSINRRINCSIREVHKFVNNIVEERRQYHKNTNYKHLDEFENNTDDDDVHDFGIDGAKKRLAILDLLLAAERNNLVDKEGIIDEVSTFVFAGHDTSGIAIIFATLIFAEYQDVQKRAREEVEKVFYKNNGKLDFSALKDLKYLERCIKESQRLYPSVPTFVRYMSEDLQMKNCLAPKGSNVMVHIIDAHKDPNFWPEPEKFDPDRFLPEETVKRHPFAYLPFSAGLRNCIGQRFASMELKIVLASILYNFYIEPVEHLSDIKIAADVITRPEHPVHAKFVQIYRS